MNCYGSGFITILLYGISGTGEENENSITTESGSNILTETSDNILIE